MYRLAVELRKNYCHVLDFFVLFFRENFNRHSFSAENKYTMHVLFCVGYNDILQEKQMKGNNREGKKETPFCVTRNSCQRVQNYICPKCEQRVLLYNFVIRSCGLHPHSVQFMKKNTFMVAIVLCQCTITGLASCSFIFYEIIMIAFGMK